MTENDFLIAECWLREAMEFGEDEHNAPYEKAIQALTEIQQYRAMEQRLQNIYGECDGLLESVVEYLIEYTQQNVPDKISKALLLTDEDVDKWEQLKGIGTIEEFKVLKEKMQDVEIAIIDRMQEFYDEYRSISQSSVDHFGGKADAIETSQNIVKGIFKDLLGLDWSNEGSRYVRT